MFCEDVYDLMGKIIPNRNFGFQLRDTKKNLITYINSGNFQKSNVEDISAENWDQLYNNDQLSNQTSIEIHNKAFNREEEVWGKYFPKKGEEKLIIKRKQEDGFQSQFWVNTPSNMYLSWKDSKITDKTHQKVIYFQDQIAELIFIYGSNQSDKLARVMSDITFGFLLAIKPAFVNKILSVMKEKGGAPIYLIKAKDVQEFNTNNRLEFHYLLIKYCSDVVDIALSDSNNAEHHTIFSLQVNLFTKIHFLYIFTHKK